MWQTIHVSYRRAALVAALPAALLLVGCGSSSSGDDDDDTGASYTVDVTPADFVAGIDNPYFPLKPGAHWTYEADTEDGHEETQDTVEDQTKMVWGVAATVVHDTVSVDGELAEDTYDWYAQDKDGNVWYLGEDSSEYEDGQVTSTEGSWEAGVDGALPGIVMKAHPALGEDPYRQEYKQGEAEDMAEVIALDATADVPAGTYSGCVKTRETTALEPDVVEFKTYCQGVGDVLEEEEDTQVQLTDYGGLN